jgi:hypothetical protein
MKRIAVVAFVAAFLTIPARAFALSFIEETFGNDPVLKQPDWAEGILDVVNLKSRVYRIKNTGGLANFVDEHFFYKGDAGALAEALRKFAAVKADERQLVLLPGPGKVPYNMGKAVEFDWQFHLRNGPYREWSGNKHAVLTVYLTAVRPEGRPHRTRVERLIGELGNDSFEKRQDAEQQLQALERDAKPFLRDALKVRTELEVRKRIERLLKRLPGLDVGDLEIPPGMTAVTAGDLLAEHLEGLSDTDLTRCNRAGYNLTQLARYHPRVVPALADLLAKDRSEYIRRVVASCLGSIGARAKTALPSLRMGLADPDPNVRTDFQTAIDQIEKARDEPESAEVVKKRMAILKNLDELGKAGKKG